ncbi:hypothetical protein FE782_04020 [Paenibacillus antri]|uniref:Uncharacterized protein n=1 Tax=Paenibacillus antri TaxID=2582848 RepID=A0A5R9GN44_9BACL|nr:hypothetical protein [Paenibacillus antri]TLS53445.1 hypothetical protein FE782_04020 [Paenibacillus antri]
MAVPQKVKPVRRAFAPLLWLLVIAGLLVGGTAAYVSTEPPLDWSSQGGPDLAEKVRGMIASQSLSVAITEAELNALVKANLYEERRLGEQAEMTGADVALDGDTLIVRTDVTIAGSIRLPLTHRFRLEWEKPDVKATHVSTALKDIPLPASLLAIGTIRVPLAFDARIPAEIETVSFEADEVRLKLKLTNPFF